MIIIDTVWYARALSWIVLIRNFQNSEMDKKRVPILQYFSTVHRKNISKITESIVYLIVIQEDMWRRLKNNCIIGIFMWQYNKFVVAKMTKILRPFVFEFYQCRCYHNCNSRLCYELKIHFSYFCHDTTYQLRRGTFKCVHLFRPYFLNDLY